MAGLEVLPEVRGQPGPRLHVLRNWPASGIAVSARKLLDPALERMMEAVHHSEGTVNQVMGDGIMALARGVGRIMLQPVDGRLVAEIGANPAGLLGGGYAIDGAGKVISSLPNTGGVLEVA
jgi:hypothetical protein